MMSHSRTQKHDPKTVRIDRKAAQLRLAKQRRDAERLRDRYDAAGRKQCAEPDPPRYKP